MYVPAHFEVNDGPTLAAFMHEHSFATLVTVADDVPFASHVPVLFRLEHGTDGFFASHVARANPQWRHLVPDTEVLVIFQGPHAYISPNWYRTQPAVPTWNYAAIHAYGFPRILESEQDLDSLLQATVEKYESGRAEPWRGELPPDFKVKMMKAVVGFEIRVTRLEGKFKLSQNRPAEDIASVIQALNESTDPTERALAALMAGRFTSPNQPST